MQLPLKILNGFFSFVTHVTKSPHFCLPFRYAIFPLLCISKWGDNIPQWLLSNCQMQPVLRLINVLHCFFHGKSGFPENIYLVNGWQSENNKPIVWRTVNLLFSKNLISCYSAPCLGNPVTYVKQSSCYEVFAIHHDLMYEPFDS